MARIIMPVDNWNGKWTDESTQAYGWRTIQGVKEFHRGVDFSAGSGVKPGTDIHAVANGTVYRTKFASDGNAGGNSITLEHNINGQKVYTYYAHMVAPTKLSVGAPVKVGDVLGGVGKTGRSWGEHLHFEIQLGSINLSGNQSPNNSVDPFSGWLDNKVNSKTHPNGVDGGGASSGGGATSNVFTPPSPSHVSAQYAAYINDAAAQTGINANIIAAVIQAESGWKADAVSPAKPPALGLMQVKSASAADIGRPSSYSDLMQPKGNILTGSLYLKTVVMERAKLGTKTEDVLRGYNMGPYGYYAVINGGGTAKNKSAYNSGENMKYYSAVSKAYKDLFGSEIPGDMMSGAGGGGGGGYATGDISPLASYGDSIEIGKQLAMTNQVSRINGISPNPDKDNYPKHRYRQNPFVLRIGDSQFYIPPLNIQHHKVGSSSSIPTMRNRTSMLVKSGWTEGFLNISMSFADIDQINGYKVEGPDGVEYYMDGVRSLLAQYHKNCMLPIRNEYINNALGIFNVIIEDIQLATVPDFPNMINVTILARECATTPYTGVPDISYDMCFNYPIWRWFYQHMLVDNENKRMESVYLRPIDKYMRSDFRIRVLDDDEIDFMKEDLSSRTDAVVTDFDTGKKITQATDQLTKINPEYLLSKFQGADIRMLMSEYDLGDIIVHSISGSVSKELSRINMLEYEEPVYQDLGGLQKQFQVQLKLTDRSQVLALETLVRIVEETAREYRHMFVGGFIEVQNDIINMCGVEFCMIEEMQVATTPVNGVYDAVIVLREFNPSQSNHESLNGIKTDINDVTKEWIKNNGELAERTYTAHKNDRTRTVNEEYLIETLIKQIELYPDLRLPSVADANKALTTINTWRKAKGYDPVPFSEFPVKVGDVWVEPDFYFMYPTPEDMYTSMGLDEMGQKISALVSQGTYDGFIQDTETGIDTWGDIASASGMSELLSTFSGKRSNTKYEMEADYTRALSAFTSFTYPNTPVYTDFFKEWHSDLEMPSVPILASLMLYDQVNYDQRCRLNRFFPTYMMLFVDEGQWIDGRRLWNSHYAYHAVHEMTVTRDKNNPVDTAYIRLSNTYGTFNSESKLKEPKDYFKYTPMANGLKGFIKEMYDAWHYTAKDLMVDAHKMMEHANLEVGARIHLRLGNSSNTSNLPIAFNGQITSVNDGMDIEIFAQGDGVELAANMISGNKGDSTPNEPHNTLQKYMTKRMSNYWFTVASDLEFFNNFESYYGIEHFGWVQSRDKADTGFSQFWTTLFLEDDDLAEEQKSTDTGWLMGMMLGAFEWGKKLVNTIVDNASQIWNTHVQFVAGLISGNPSFVVYDVMKNIYRGRTDLASTGVIFKSSQGNTSTKGTGFWANFNPKDGEKNVTLAEMNKTVWDIGTSLSMFVPEFIFATHHHGLRSTVFFGMPHWLVKFRYHKPDDAPMDDLTKWKEEVKPFQQVHVISASVDLIHNGIHASSELLKHDQTTLFSKGDAMNTKEGITVYADKSILNDQRRRDVVETGVLQDLFGPDSLINGIAVILKGVYSVVMDGVEDVVNWATTPLRRFGVVDEWSWEDGIMGKIDEFLEFLAYSGEDQAKDVGIGNVQRNFMEMYQGEIVLFGQGSIKPWDLMHMNDPTRIMSGTVQVGAVTHTLSRRTGFLTVVKPDLVVTRVDNVQGRSEVLKTATRFAAFGSLSVLRVMSMNKFGRALMSGTFKKARTVAIKGVQVIDNIGHRFTGIKVIDEIRDYLDGKLQVAEDGEDDKKKNNDSKTKGKRQQYKVELATKNGRMKRLLMKGLKVAGRNLITMAIAGTAEEFFGRWWEKKTMYNNVIYIHPLLKGGVPYTAGIKGALHIIPTYTDGRYADIDGQIASGAAAQPATNINGITEEELASAKFYLTSPVEMLVKGDNKLGTDKMTPTHIVIHETGSTSMNAKQAAEYQSNGGSKADKKSWHFSVDQSTVYQSYPLDWKAVHAGTDAGNNGGIGIALCVNTGNDYDKTFDLAAKLTADIMNILNLSITNLYTHQYFVPADTCPQKMLEAKRWDEFKRKVSEYMVKGTMEKSQDGQVVTDKSAKDEKDYSGNADVSVVQITPKYTTADTAVETNPDFTQYIGTKALSHPAVMPINVSISAQFSTTNKFYGTKFKTTKAGIIGNVQSIAQGKVVLIETDSLLGYTVVIEHAGALNNKVWYSSYHGIKKSDEANLSVGRVVERSTVIGTSGGLLASSGTEFQVQIHLGSYTKDASLGKGARVNPVDFMKKGGITL